MRAIAVALLLSTTPAAAEWKVHTARDRMTDREVKWATVTTRSDQGVTGTLHLRCLVHDLVGGRIMDISTSSRFTRGNMSFRYRIDGAPVEERFMPVNSDRDGVSNFMHMDDVQDAKRIRVEMTPGRSPALLFDFDVTGLARIMQSMPCKNTRRIN